MATDGLERISIILATTMATSQWDVELPIDVPVQALIKKLATEPGLPFHEVDDHGNTDFYRLMWREGDRYLSEIETLREAGVQSGQTLIMALETSIETQLKAELSRCFSTSPRSFALLKTAGYPSSMIPPWDWDTAPEDFWESVYVEIARGVMERGLERLALAALRTYGANSIFATAVRRLRGEESERVDTGRRPSPNSAASAVINPEDITTRQEFAHLLEAESFIAAVEIGDLARAAGVTTNTVRRWLSGRALPSAAGLYAILRICAKQSEFERWNNALTRARAQPISSSANRADRRDQDATNLLLRLYIPSERLYAAEARRLLSLFHDWMTKTRGPRFRQVSYRTTAGEMFEFFAVDHTGRQSDLQGEFNSFADFLTLCSTDPSAAADKLAPLGLARAAASDFVGRLGTEVRRLQVDLAQEREKRVMAIRHDLEKQIVDNGIALQAVPSHQIQALIDRLVPGPTASESLALLAKLESVESVPSISLQINQQFINAIESQVVQNIQGTVNLGPQAKQLLELIAQFGGSQTLALVASVHELEDSETPIARRNAAKRRLRNFVNQLIGVARDVAVDTLEKYLESKGL